MKEELNKVTKSAEQDISQASSLHELMILKSRYVGKKSVLNGFMKKIGSLPKEERPAFGATVNKAKQSIAEILATKEQEIKQQEYNKTLQSQKIDITMPGRRIQRGSLHPITKVWREIEDIFISLGFDVAEGPDVEDEFHNFDALNTPQDHPARDLSDTFYLDDDVLLRTQTSTVQIRVMEKHKPPIKIISPGSCYRNENDASHSPMFHQVEALVVDEGINFVDLRDMLNVFVKKMFGDDIESRFRPHFFPFTEPSAEIDIICVKCHGKGCNVCKGSGWLEMGGAGMVDPNVFDMLGIDSEKYTGYAFGLGMDRIAMLKYKIPDMRMLFENDIRFLKQF
ncbi:MAG: phenylalanine--tRNA ligase subunit alpha [Candidatus Cloacimonetes bacterium]|nr:phenylalanine--tRNA ligase subunit alpha [Candidatus Cloacimonadota bacterium]MCF7814594.1 phenylalanine--tRNA ligase subunit alpha [Candidatus Cloacimonadota bacterium]MCF7869074.1 phenylalanine--tRNA ligase subunit alpha [Candidatus Cloacimonadota bacterium]MCF7884491.1 phenylalanine--tRNA ligase subunit alpha [Candidatus Cloacimonadota bacterium]